METDYKRLKAREIIDLCCLRGIDVDPSENSRADLIKLLQAYDAEQHEKGGNLLRLRSDTDPFSYEKK